MPAHGTVRWGVGVVVSAAALAAVAAAPAAAESVVTSQARAAGVDWISGVPAQRWPSPAERPVICLIDSGVAVTPDTPADNPDGPIVARLGLVDGDPGTPSSSDPNGMHGTQMAAAMAAPRNGWGIVGVWPGARIVSVKTTMDTGGFLDTSILSAMSRCRAWAVNNGVKVAAINLSLGSQSVGSSTTDALMVDRVADMQVRGASTIGAAGNTPGGATNWPANVKGVLSVGASTLSGGWCQFASRDWQTTLAAPGCDIAGVQLSTGREGTWDGASSAAAAMVSATIAAIRSLRPDSTREQVEQWVTASGAPLDAARLLDGRQIANAAGVGDLLAYAPPAESDSAPSGGGLSLGGSGPVARISPSKRIRVRLRGRSLTITAAPAAGGVQLQVAVRQAGRWTIRSGKRSVTIRGAGRPARVWVRWSGPDAESLWAAYRRPASSRAKLWARDRSPAGPRPPVRQTEQQ